MRFALVTFGCRVNQAESLGLEGDLRASGAEPAPAEAADLVIVNTCTVTAAADQGARQAIRRIARRNPAAKIVVTGCYATRSPEDVRGLPGVLRLVRNEQKGRLGAELAPELSLEADPPEGGGAEGCERRLWPGLQGRTAYFLQAQTGCDERCAYCVVPSTRGKSRSRPIDDVVAEARRAARSGFKELMLTGVHLGSYGRDLAPARSLEDLLRAMDSCGADLLFRLSSIEPMDCTSRLVDLVAGSGRFAPHFHLPLQHASDRVLRAMRRPYSASSWRRLVDSIRARMPDAAIGTDLIAGFPGETDIDLQQCLDLLDDSPLTSVHVFPYSDRPGTAAAAMTPKVHAAVVRQRAEALAQRAREVARRFEQSQVGRVLRGLTLGDGSLVLTDNYLKVRIPPGRRRNEWVRVRIVAAAGTVKGTMTGTTVEGRP